MSDDRFDDRYDDNDLGGVPPCDECDSDNGSLWCDTCNAALCPTCGNASGKHQGHAVGTIGSCHDPYEYQQGLPGATAGSSPDGPTGVIEELVTEEQAYHIVEMLESNAHLSCRKLFSPSIQQLRRQLVVTGNKPPSPWRNFASATAKDEATSSVRPLLLSNDDWLAFASHSYLVIDHFVDPATALAARAQTLQLLSEGHLTEFMNPGDVNRDHTARTDLRMFLNAGDTQHTACTGALGELVERLTQLRDVLAQSVQLTGEQHEYQLAYYGTSGEHYKRHRDAFPNDGTRVMKGQPGRRVTCTLYMNEFEEEHGGKLRLYVPDSTFETETPLDVAPKAGRAVLFLAGAMDHEVLPSFAPRCAIAAWYS